MSRLLTTLLLYRSGFYVGKYISLEAKIAKNKDLYYDALSAYDPGDLEKTAAGFDAVLLSYLREYEKAGLKPKVYPDADAFAAAYTDPAAE